MRTKNTETKKINVVTLGCSKNIYDSEVLMGQLKANDLDVTHESGSKSDIVIINTCGFIDNAKQESIDTILHYAKQKMAGEVEQVIVTGCLSERYKDDLVEEIPDVDAYFGTHDLPRLLNFVGADYKHELIGERTLTTPSHFSFLKISEGCDRPCAFCAIPIMRGKHMSTPIEDLVVRAKALAAKGVKELITIAQDSTYYGLDLYGERRLAELLHELSKVEGIEWIRLHYAFPTGFPLDILDEMRENKKICSYLDIPLQHINDEVLKRMRRGTTYDKTTRLIKTIRDKVPGIAIRTTLISGFPGETNEQHQEMLNWVKVQKFERLGVFTYSHEEDTHAHTYEDDVPQEVKEERAAEIMMAQQSISRERNEKLIGTTLKVLIDRKEDEYFVGRTEFDSPDVDNEVLISAANNYVRVGDFVEVEVQDAEDFDLFAQPLVKTY